MHVQTIVDQHYDGAKTYTSYCRREGAEEYQDVTLFLAPVTYDDAFAQALADSIEAYGIHTTFTSDYESSSDAGDGRDDYYVEEQDESIPLAACIVKDGAFIGVFCEAFDLQQFVLLDYPETVIFHPQNYGGRNYHYYRKKHFRLMKK